MKFFHGIVLILSGFSLASAQLGNLDLGASDRSQGGSANYSFESQGRAPSNAQPARISTLPSDAMPYTSDQSVVDSLYVVGPGDVFQIVFESNAVEKQVTPEGNISLNRIGVVELEGLTLRAAKKRLLERLHTTYRKGDCFVGLARPKAMKIFVTGAVNNPGTFEVAGNMRVADAIRAAGGFSGMAQKEEVRITLGDVTHTADVQKFIREGDLSANPYLLQGAVVHVPFVDYGRSWVTVRRGGETFAIQTAPGESLEDAIFKSYGFASPAPYVAVLVREKGRSDSVVTASEARAYVPGPQAYIETISAHSEIFVAGAVARPGAQGHISNRRAIQYISAAGLLTNSRVPEKISVIRKNGKRESVPIQSAAIEPGDVMFVGQNAEQRFLIYTPILLSVVSLALVYMQIVSLN